MTNQVFDQPVEISSNNANASNLNALELLSEKCGAPNYTSHNLPDIEITSNSEDYPKCGPRPMAGDHHKPVKPEMTIKPEIHHKPVKPEMTIKPEIHHKPVKPEMTIKPEIHHKPVKPEMIKPVKPAYEPDLESSKEIAQLLMDGSIDIKDQVLIRSLQSQANERGGIKAEAKLLDQINQVFENNNSPYSVKSGRTHFKLPGLRRLELVETQTSSYYDKPGQAPFQSVVDNFEFKLKMPSSWLK